MGNGTNYSYKVISVDTVEDNRAEAYLFSQKPKLTKQLNLITSGIYVKSKQYYDKRIIVSTEQVN